MSASSADSLADNLTQPEAGAPPRPDDDAGDPADDLAALLHAADATSDEAVDVAVDDDGDAIVVADDDDEPAADAEAFDAVEALRAVTHGDDAAGDGDAIQALEASEAAASDEQVDDDEGIASELAAATTGPAWIAPSAGAGATRSSRGKPAPGTKEGDGIKGVFAPILLALGVILLIPAFWSAGQLLGFEVWSHDEPKARIMAIAMLICWPLAGVILGAAVMMIKQVLRRKKKAKA